MVQQLAKTEIQCSSVQCSALSCSRLLSLSYSRDTGQSSTVKCSAVQYSAVQCQSRGFAIIASPSPTRWPQSREQSTKVLKLLMSVQSNTVSKQYRVNCILGSVHKNFKLSREAWLLQAQLSLIYRPDWSCN